MAQVNLEQVTKKSFLYNGPSKVGPPQSNFNTKIVFLYNEPSGLGPLIDLHLKKKYSSLL